MLFECFYYPILNTNNKVVKYCDNLIEFNFGDKVPNKTLYYNYGENFIIYQGGEFFSIEDGVLTGCIEYNNITFPTNIIFNKGTQLTINSKKDLKSIRLVLNGEFETEKSFGNLLFLYNSISTKIKHAQYNTLSLLTNSARNCSFVNNELDINTEKLIYDLHIVKSMIINFIIKNPSLETDYLNYMNFSDSDLLLDFSIYRYFVKDSKEYKDYYNQKLNCNKKISSPKLKLANMLKSCNIDSSAIS